MKRLIALCACILVLLAIPATISAAPVGEENVTPTPANGQMDNITENMTIAEYIVQDENLTTLAAALNATGLLETLNGTGPYTVFAPNDEAFEELGNVTVNRLLTQPENLTEILQYHVVEGNYTAENITNMTQEEEEENGMFDFLNGLFGNGNQTEQQNQTQNMTVLETISGEQLNVTVEDGEVMVENATVVEADIELANGVIHIIDRVLVPAGVELPMENETGMVDNQTMNGDNQTVLPPYAV